MGGKLTCWTPYLPYPDDLKKRHPSKESVPFKGPCTYSLLVGWRNHRILKINLVIFDQDLQLDLGLLDLVT